MPRLSVVRSQFATSVHYGFLPFAALLISAVLYWNDYRRGELEAPWIYVTTTIVLLVILIRVLRAGLWRMADFVDLRDSQIFVGRRRTFDSFPLSNVKSITGYTNQKGGEIELKLHRPCALGDTVHFYLAPPCEGPAIRASLERISEDVTSRGGASSVFFGA